MLDGKHNFNNEYYILLLCYSNVPIFIRVQHEWRNVFIGLCEGSGLRTHFNICHVKNSPHQYRHLAGLLEIFKSKLVGKTTCYVAYYLTCQNNS